MPQPAVKDGQRALSWPDKGDSVGMLWGRTLAVVVVNLIDDRCWSCRPEHGTIMLSKERGLRRWS